MSDGDIMADNRRLFAAAVEDALNEIGGPTLEMVSLKLAQQYRCSLTDCLENPGYLKSVLHEIFGHAEIAVVAKIRKNLGEFSEERPVGEFLRILTG